MTHEQIILWIQENVIGILKMNDKTIISYFDQETGNVIGYSSDTLILGVLAINKVELT